MTEPEGSAESQTGIQAHPGPWRQRPPLVPSSELVEVVAKRRHRDLDVLALPDRQNQLLHLAAYLHAVALQVLPVVEDALREGLAARLLAQRRDEAEGLGHWQVRLHLNERGALAGVLL